MICQLRRVLCFQGKPQSHNEFTCKLKLPIYHTTVGQNTSGTDIVLNERNSNLVEPQYISAANTQYPPSLPDAASAGHQKCTLYILAGWHFMSNTYFQHSSKIYFSKRRDFSRGVPGPILILSNLCPNAAADRNISYLWTV